MKGGARAAGAAGAIARGADAGAPAGGGGAQARVQRPLGAAPETLLNLLDEPGRPKLSASVLRLCRYVAPAGEPQSRPPYHKVEMSSEEAMDCTYTPQRPANAISATVEKSPPSERSW